MCNINLEGKVMTCQARRFVLHLATKVNVYQLMAVSLALGVAILGMPGSYGGGFVILQRENTTLR
jgi:hypothetical protein